MMSIVLAGYKRRICVCLFSVAVCALAQVAVAQEQHKTLRLTLEEAKVMALKNNALIRAGQLDERAAQKAVAEQRWKRIPQLYADYNMQRNLIIPVTPVPANAFDPSAPEGAVVPMRFATDWSSNAGINGGFDLYNPQRRGSIREAIINQQLARLESEQTANDIGYQAATAYVDVMIAAEQLRLTISDTVSKWELLQTSRQQYDEGRLLLSALNQVRADRNTALNNFEEASDIYYNSKMQLLFALGVESDDNVALELVDDAESIMAQVQKESDRSSDQGISYQKQRQNDALLQTRISSALKAHLPTVQLNGYYGANYFDNNLELFKSNNWYGNSFVNLGIRLPLTEGLERHEKVAQLKLQQQADLLRFQHEQNQNKLEYANAVRAIHTFERNLERVRENFRLAEVNLRLAEQQFSSGRLLLSELSQINYTYQIEKNNYLNFVYNYIAAKIKADKLSRF